MSSANTTSSSFAPTERQNQNQGFVRDVHPAGLGAFQPTHSGIIETTKVDPLNDKSDAQEWAETTRPAGAPATWTGMATGAASTATGIAASTALGVASSAASTGMGIASGAASTATGIASGAASTATGLVSGTFGVATGAAKLAYGTATGNQEVKQQGNEQVWGKQ
ncbi:hypothetical protein EXIGLDRAFT_743987 [Exidia glandulosa HHB12029]|uniref:Uncharacterized protein n=1 Tax=Exidia glandulosa HHB12029 TaxID=1314781 RepID=A0A165QH02_EXIGL|nr:hypothetical protein EXIGLDRAFT_743987 [Exidia glandulosa HHB12029]